MRSLQTRAAPLAALAIVWNVNSAHLSLPPTCPSLLRFVAQIHCSNSLLSFVVQICCTDWLHTGCSDWLLRSGAHIFAQICCLDLYVAQIRCSNSLFRFFDCIFVVQIRWSDWLLRLVAHGSCRLGAHICLLRFVAQTDLLLKFVARNCFSFVIGDRKFTATNRNRARFTFRSIFKFRSWFRFRAIHIQIRFKFRSICSNSDPYLVSEPCMFRSHSKSEPYSNSDPNYDSYLDL